MRYRMSMVVTLVLGFTSSPVSDCGGQEPDACLQDISTGFDQDAGVPLQEGGKDQDYTVRGIAAFTGGAAQGFPIPPWVPNDARSTWISVQPDSRVLGGQYLYSVRFTLPVQDETTSVSIAGRWAAEDSATLTINGMPSGLHVSGAEAFTDFPADAGQGLFVTGENVLEFAVQKADTTILGEPSGLRVEACISACSPQDVHCTSISVDPPLGPPGMFLVQAQASDVAMGPIFYTFTATSPLSTIRVGPQLESSAELFLAAGDWIVTAAVHNDPDCAPESQDPTCGTVVEVRIDGGGQVPSDGNQDRFLDLSDAVLLLRHIFSGVPLLLPCDGGTLFDPGNISLVDANGDGDGDLSDAVWLLNYLFLGTLPPVLGTACIPIEGCPALCTTTQDANDPAALKSAVSVDGNCGEDGTIYTNTTGGDLDVVLTIWNSGDCDVEITSGATKFTVPAGTLATLNEAFRVLKGNTVTYTCKAGGEVCEFIYWLRRLGVGQPADSPYVPNIAVSSWYENRECGETGVLFTNRMPEAIDVILTLNNTGDCDLKTTVGDQDIVAKAGGGAQSTAVRVEPGESWEYECRSLVDETCEFFWSVGERGLSSAGSPIAESNYVATVGVNSKCNQSGVLFKNTLPEAMVVTIKIVNTGHCDVTISVTDAGDVIQSTAGMGVGDESATTVVTVPSGGEVKYTCQGSVDVNSCVFSAFIREVPQSATSVDGNIGLGGLQDATAENCAVATGEIFVNRLGVDLEVELGAGNNGVCPVKVFLDGNEVLSVGSGESDTETVTVPKNGGTLTFNCLVGQAAGPCLFIYTVRTAFVE